MNGLVEEHRGRLFGIAYGMLGSVSDAEDTVQEAFVRLAAAKDVRDPAAWLTTVVTNIGIDRLRSAQRNREVYVGPWLPEPLITDPLDPADLAATADSLTLAFLTVLERLSPAERAVFLLHDVFAYPHGKIAEMLDRSPLAVRKLATRARQRLGEDRPRFQQDATRRGEVADAFHEACWGADLDRLMTLLAPDVTFISDGGGFVSAARRPVSGRPRVAQFLLGLLRDIDDAWTFSWLEINRQPGLVVQHGGRVDTLQVLHVVDAHIQSIHTVRNPTKLDAVRRSLPVTNPDRT